MEALFASGRIVDAILLLVAIEALILIPWRRGAGSSPWRPRARRGISTGWPIPRFPRSGSRTGSGYWRMNWGRKASWRHGAKSAERLVQEAETDPGRSRGMSKLQIFETKSLNKNTRWL